MNSTSILMSFSSLKMEGKPWKKFKKGEGYNELDFEKVFSNGIIKSVKCKLCSYETTSLSKEKMWMHQ